MTTAAWVSVEASAEQKSGRLRKLEPSGVGERVRAGSVFTVAAHRCSEVFEPPGCVTLWRLLESTEEEFDARWEHWLDNAAEWAPFFLELPDPRERISAYHERFVEIQATQSRERDSDA